MKPQGLSGAKASARGQGEFGSAVGCVEATKTHRRVFPVRQRPLEHPTVDAIQKRDFRKSLCFDVFVPKLKATGSALVYSTYLGNVMTNSV